MFVAETDEDNAIGGSVDKKGLDLAQFFELKEFAVVERNALAFADPVFAVLFFEDLLGLEAPLESGDVGFFSL